VVQLCFGGSNIDLDLAAYCSFHYSKLWLFTPYGF
jgi:hypothetical protein